MARLDRLHSQLVAEAPSSFEERLKFWRARGSLGEPLHGSMHVLRRWRNAAEHDDGERWRVDGPRDDAELFQILRECDAAVTRMERS